MQRLSRSKTPYCLVGQPRAQCNPLLMKQKTKALIFPENSETLSWQLQTLIDGDKYDDFTFPLDQFAGANISLPNALTVVHPLNDRGDAVMLALAYGKNQRQEVKIHRPELCYPAQGYKVNSLRPVTFTGITDTQTGKNVTGQRMVVQARNSMEVVSYWIRIGDTYSSSPWQVRWQIMKEGLQGRTTDGMLVRVSQRVRPGEDAAPHHALVESFARELVAAVPPQTRSYLVR